MASGGIFMHYNLTFFPPSILAAIMMRVRRNEASFHRKSSPTQETSFYYKESSANSSLSKDETSGKIILSQSFKVFFS